MNWDLFQHFDLYFLLTFLPPHLTNANYEIVGYTVV